MAHYWGSFADGFARGFGNGWDLGERINEAIDRRKFQSAVSDVDKKADEAYTALDNERDEGSQAAARKSARGNVGESSSLVLGGAGNENFRAPGEGPAALPTDYNPDAERVSNAARAVELPSQRASKAVATLPGSTAPESAPPVDDAALEQYLRSGRSGDVERAIPARAADADDARTVSDSEYMNRRAAIAAQQKRDTLRARLDYLKYQNPEAYMQAKQELYDMDTDAAVEKTIAGMEAGDPNAIGVAVRTLSDMGFFPEGAQPREGKDGTIDLVGKDGKVLWSGLVTKDLVKQGIPLFAMAAKAKAKRDWKSMFELRNTMRTQHREDEADALAKKRLDYEIMNGNRTFAQKVKEFGYKQVQDAIANKFRAMEFDQKEAHFNAELSEKKYVHDWSNWGTVAGINGYGSKGSKSGSGSGGAGNWSMTNLPPGTKLGEDENGNPAVFNVKTGEQMSRYNLETRNAEPDYKPTPTEQKTRQDLSAKGWIDSYAFDDSGRAKYTMQNPKTGQYVFADDPTHVYEGRETRAPLPPFPERGKRWNPNAKAAQFPWEGGESRGSSSQAAPQAESHTSVSTTKSETQKDIEHGQKLLSEDPGRSQPVAMDGGMPDVPEAPQGSALAKAEARLKELEAYRAKEGWSWGWEMEHRQALVDYRRLRYGKQTPQEAEATSAPAVNSRGEELPSQDPGHSQPVAKGDDTPKAPEKAPAAEAKNVAHTSSYTPEDFYKEYGKPLPPSHHESVTKILDNDADRAVTARRAAAYAKLGAHEYDRPGRAYGAPISGADDFYRQYSNGALFGGVSETVGDFYEQYSGKGFGPKTGSFDPIGKILDDTYVTKKPKAIDWASKEAIEDYENLQRSRNYGGVMHDAESKAGRGRKPEPMPKLYPHEKAETQYPDHWFDVDFEGKYKGGNYADYVTAEWIRKRELVEPALAELVTREVDVKKLTGDQLSKIWKDTFKSDIPDAQDDFFSDMCAKIKAEYKAIKDNGIDVKKWAKSRIEDEISRAYHSGHLKANKHKSKKEAK